MSNLEFLTDQFEANSEFYRESPENLKGFDRWQFEFETLISLHLKQIDELDVSDAIKNSLRGSFIDFVLREESSLDDDLLVTDFELEKFMQEVVSGYEYYEKSTQIVKEIAKIRLELDGFLDMARKQAQKSKRDFGVVLKEIVNQAEYTQHLDALIDLFGKALSLLESSDRNVSRMVALGFENDPSVFAGAIRIQGFSKRADKEFYKAKFRICERIFDYGLEHRLFAEKMLMFLDPRGDSYEQLRALSNPTFRNVEGMNEDGYIPRALRKSVSEREESKIDTSGLYFIMDSLEQIIQARGDVSDLKVYIQNNLIEWPAHSELPSYSDFKRSTLDLIDDGKYRECLTKVREFREALKDHMDFGDGRNMTNIDAFSRVGRLISSLPETENLSEVNFSYPGSGAHLSILETVSQFVLANRHLERVNLNFTEILDVRSDLLSLLGHIQSQNDALSDIGTFTEVTQEFSSDRENWTNVYRLEFRVHGKLVNLNLFLNAQNFNTGGHYLGVDNINRSDLIFIHDLDGAESNAVTSIAKQVLLEGKTRLVVFPKAYYRPGRLSNLGVDFTELYFSEDEQYGCSCNGIAHEGMVVLRVKPKSLGE